MCVMPFVNLTIVCKEFINLTTVRKEEAARARPPRTPYISRSFLRTGSQSTNANTSCAFEEGPSFRGGHVPRERVWGEGLE